MQEEFVPLKPHMEPRVLNKMKELKGEILSHRKKSKNPLRKLIPGNTRKHKEEENKKLKKFRSTRDSLVRTIDDKLKRSNARTAVLKAGIELLNKKIDQEEPKNNIRRLKREEIEFLLDYLLDEGYANDEKSASKILEVMSEEWYNEILDEAWKPADTAKMSGQAYNLEKRRDPNYKVLDTAIKHLSSKNTRTPSERNLRNRDKQRVRMSADNEKGHGAIDHLIRTTDLKKKENQKPMLDIAGKISRNAIRDRAIQTVQRMQTRRTPSQQRSQDAVNRFEGLR